MSVRGKNEVAQLKEEIASLKRAALAPKSEQHMMIEAQQAFYNLSPTEQDVASLGIDPDELRPIAWLNAGHYEALQQNHRLERGLAKQINSYKTIASSES
jgi:hypothetical protein